MQTSITSQGFYQGELRPVLEHLLAARLAERHGVNLYQDPRRPAGCCAAARATPTCGRGSTRDQAGGPVRDAAGQRRGIPRRTLARLIDRLEKL